MEEKIFINAYAKINLLLDVLRRRDDGYHELDGIMQSVSLHDEIALSPAEGIEVVSSEPLPYDNTCRRAAEAFLEGSGKGVRIEAEKRIPSEAGMGGASADAAAVLRGLDALYPELSKTEEELYKIGLSVGADVPFCLMGGCARAGGVGEKLAPLRGLRLPLVIVRGGRGVSTGKLFSSLGTGSEEKTRLPDGAMKKALSALEKGEVNELAGAVCNALTEPACRMAPEIAEYRARLMESGALGASMTGSGAAVFGIFPSREKACAALPHFSDCAFAAYAETLPAPAPSIIRFRPASADDAPLTAFLRREAWLTTYRGVYPDELLDGFDLAAREARDRAMLSSPDITGFIIEADGAACGFMILEAADGLYIRALYLLKEYRGAGIGSAAFRVIRGIARKSGHSSFTCSCNSHNSPALAFYEKMGGRERSRSEGHENRREDQVTFEFRA